MNLMRGNEQAASNDVAVPDNLELAKFCQRWILTKDRITTSRSTEYVIKN